MGDRRETDPQEESGEQDDNGQRQPFGGGGFVGFALGALVILAAVIAITALVTAAIVDRSRSPAVIPLADDVPSVYHGEWVGTINTQMAGKPYTYPVLVSITGGAIHEHIGAVTLTNPAKLCSADIYLTAINPADIDVTENDQHRTYGLCAPATYTITHNEQDDTVTIHYDESVFWAAGTGTLHRA